MTKSNTVTLSELKSLKINGFVPSAEQETPYAWARGSAKWTTMTKQVKFTYFCFYMKKTFNLDLAMKQDSIEVKEQLKRLFKEAADM